jgi:ATP-dependent RNA helicase RhlE
MRPLTRLNNSNAPNSLGFSQFGLAPVLNKALAELGYETPTPIQQQAIGPLLQGKDLLGCAQTGTGKTAAFSLPILERLLRQPRPRRSKSTRVLILTPTRELALQIDESIKGYAKHTSIRSAVVFGGVNQNPQVRTLSQGLDILVATPGRLLDLQQQGFVDLSQVEVFVLDEADRMLDMGFIHDVRRIIGRLPAKRHNLFFSATMPPEISRLAESILVSPARVEVTPVSSTAEKVQQSVVFVERGLKKDALKQVLARPDMNRVIVFTRTKRGANVVSEVLSRAGITSAPIHGNKSQSARQRALDDFKAGKIRVLVATDIASRGIDVDSISHVINFELPNIPESYVHRIGRTARAGREGSAISFCDHEERAYLRDIERLIKTKIDVLRLEGLPALASEPSERPPAASGGPRPQASARPAGGRGPRSRRPRRR